jgi:broad specificity phosphatase PhoE
MATELFLVRHGQVDKTGNVATSGHLNPPLSELGQNSAEKIAARLGQENSFAAIYTSPLTRAMQTAGFISEKTNLKPIVVESLREWNFSHSIQLYDRSRLYLYTLLSHYKPFKRNLARMWATSPNLKIFIQTVSEAVNKIIECHPNQRVIIVAHGGTIDAILTHYFPEEDTWERGVIRNCSLTILAIGNESVKIMNFNDCTHLA